MLVSQGGQAVPLREAVVRPMGRPAAGVIGIRMAKGDRVIASEAVAGARICCVVAQKGLGKRTDTDHFITKGRGGKGVTAMKLTARTGQIVGAGMVDDDHNDADEHVGQGHPLAGVPDPDDRTADARCDLDEARPR